MKKIVAILIAFLVPAFALAGCNVGGDNGAATYSVTFVQQGQKDIVISVEKGQALTGIPTPAPVVGHDVSWDKTDFSKIDANVTVNAVATPKTYTIYYTISEVLQNKPITLSKTSQQVTYGQEFTLISASYVENGETFVLMGWKNLDGEDFTAGVWNYTEDITLVTKGFRTTTDKDWS